MYSQTILLWSVNILMYFNWVFFLLKSAPNQASDNGVMVEDPKTHQVGGHLSNYCCFIS